MKPDGHIEEFKIRLKPADADLFRALAGKKGIPPAVLARAIVLEAMAPTLSPGPSVPTKPENRRPA